MTENTPGVCSVHRYSVTMSKTASQALETRSQQQHCTFILTNRLYHHGKGCTGFTGSLEKPVEDHNCLYLGLCSLKSGGKVAGTGRLGHKQKMPFCSELSFEAVCMSAQK